MKLYPAQDALVSRLLARGRPLACTVVGSTGVGKTGMAVRTAAALGAQRILVICPAIVRYGWAAEFAAWSRRIDVGIVEMGRTRKSGTKKALLARDWAYSQNIQIVSYDLVSQVDKNVWDMVIVDESHNLGDPLSKQSRTIKEFRGHCPRAHWLMLTATPIPTDAKQVWYPQWLLHGSKQWGKPAINGGVSWDFAKQFLYIDKNEYGTAIGGLRPERGEALKELVASGAEFISRAEIADDLPPLDVRPLYTSKVDKDFYETWLDLPEDITHACIVVHQLATAAMLRTLSTDREVFYIDGAVPPLERRLILEEAAASPKALLIATDGSIGEGIRMMWVQKALIAEWRRSPGQVTQLLGRFQSVGDPRRPIVEVAIDEDSDGYAELLLARVADINQALRSDTTPAFLEQVFQPRPLDSDRMKDLLSSMLGSFNEAKSAWDSGEDDDGD